MKPILRPRDYLEAARVPAWVQPQSFGPWTIERRRAEESILHEFDAVGWPDYTLLRRVSVRTLHQDFGEVVMEDSIRELRRHLPIWMTAYGRVLVTGLGLGCVVRGLLASPRVEHIDVIEIDPMIIGAIGVEFAQESRVSFYRGDALTIDLPGCWEFAWHDLWTDGEVHLQRLHAQLFARFLTRCEHQGAWAFPREVSRLLPFRALGTPRFCRRIK